MDFNTTPRHILHGDTDLEVGPLTVIVARNGMGKTSILDGLRIIFGTYTTAFDYRSSAAFSSRDIRLCAGDDGDITMASSVGAEATMYWGGKYHGVSRELRGERGRTTIKCVRELTDLGKAFKEDREQGKSVQWPVLAYYGTGRLWGEHRDRDKQKYLVRRDDYGYENCLGANSNFKAVSGWLTDAVMEGLLKSKNGRQQPSGAIGLQRQAIMGALSSVLEHEGYDADLHVDFYDKSLAIHQDGISIPVSQLSDGVRAVFGLVADLAFRCAKLNKHLGAEAAKLAQGLVMIDEIDLHLHPSWQQRILDDLQVAFPKLQFVVTTHSPQVVSSIPCECLRILDGERPVSTSPISTLGARAEQVLTEIFGVSPRPTRLQVTKDLEAFRKLIAQDKWDSPEGVALRNRLNDSLRTDPVMSELDMEIHLKSYQRKHREADI